VKLEESHDLGNLFVGVVKYDQISDVDGFHPDHSDLVNLTDSTFPHVIYNLTQFSNCIYPTFQSLGTFQEVEALQISLMVMSGSRNLDEIPEPCQKCISSQNHFLHIISLDANSLLMDCGIFRHNFFVSQDWVSDQIDHYVVVNSSSCRTLVSNLGLECIFHGCTIMKMISLNIILDRRIHTR